MQNAKCKICRRMGTKLFLKGEKCLSPKCVMIKKPYPPGLKRKKRGSPLSEYGKELKEKQKLKNWYNLSERQFANYVRKILERRGGSEDAAILLIRKLENRLDNVVYRLGFAQSRVHARKLITHSHFLVNEKSTNIPSRQLKKDDRVIVKSVSAKKTVFQYLLTTLKKHKTPAWLELNIEKLEGKVIGVPNMEEFALPVEISSIFEHYSR